MAWFLLYIFATGRKEETEMKERYSKKLTYMGAGCGVVLFAIFGLLPGSFLGGVMGLNIAGSLLGMPVTAGIASRLIVAASMVIGVMVSGIMFITASSLVGWLIGTVVDGLRAEKKEMVTAEHK
jgi:predicted benzoate:H+ symporter BenE